jgi:hypothetical protein
VRSTQDALLADRLNTAIKDHFGPLADCIEVFAWKGFVHLRGIVPEECHGSIVEFARGIEPEARIIDELEYCTPVT